MLKETLLDKLLKQLDKPAANFWFVALFCSETFLFIPLDLVLVMYVVHNHAKAFFYTIAASCGSVFSATLGYFAGAYAFERFGDVFFTFVSRDLFFKIVKHHQEFGNLVTFVATFLPLPFKAVTFSAGISGLSLIPFLLTIFVSRICRFSLISMLAIKLQDDLIPIIKKYFKAFLIGFCLLFIAGLLYFWLK